MQIGSKINRYQHYDANSAAGYGRLEPKFHKPRSFIQYPEPPEDDESIDGLIDDKTYKAVIKKLLSYTPSDPYAKNKTDPFHFVDGATKLSELSASKGMVPFPKMYSKKQAVVGGTAPRLPAGPTLAFRTRIKPTGTKKGWSSAPYDVRSDMLDNEDYNYETLKNQDLDARHVDLIKKIVNLIHLEQE
tara:strand:+ start:1385 stop:1948 length:564 start_codon:yes stop_codon:yes gene_type:complete